MNANYIYYANHSILRGIMPDKEMKRTMGKKYRVWEEGNEEKKDTVYADTHREAKKKYAAKHGISWAKVESQKV